MFRNRHNYQADFDNTEKYFYALAGLAAVAVTILGVAAIKQDMAETRDALAAGRKVFYVMGQKVIV